MAQQAIRLGPNPPEAISGTPANVISGTPQTKTQNYYSGAQGTFHVGCWESTPGKWPVTYTEEEFCVILEGRVRLTDANGKSEIYEKGDALVIPSGFSGTWETIEPTRKWYAISERPAKE